MKRTLTRKLSSSANMVPVMRGLSSESAVRGVSASSVECDICHLGCTFLPPQEQAACHVLCNLTLCP